MVDSPAPVPDHYYGGNVPVFRPTPEQFHDFKSYMESINHFGMGAGILKIIPPKTWIDSLPDLTKKLETLRLKTPIVQHIMGSQGTFTQTNIEKRRSYTLNQWHDLCHDKCHRPPPTAGERASLITRAKKKESPRADPDQPLTSNATCEESLADVPSHSSTEAGSSLSYAVASASQLREISELPISSTIPPALLTSVSTKQSKPPGRDLPNRDPLTKPRDDTYGGRKEARKDKLTFDYRCSHPKKYDEEYCRELERAYWRNLTFNQPMYGADMSGTLFDERTSSWNINNLDNILNRIQITLPGVNTPYLYFGMWKATFAWHVEDMDLYSINYLHFGAPKQWYVIPTPHRQRFERVMQATFWEDYKKCNQFLRHKTFIVSPTVLANHSIPVHRLVQHEGEFVVTFPFGYHSGYNLGFNCAESVNFAFDSWIEIGKSAKACACIGDSVNIDVSILERMVKGEALSMGGFCNHVIPHNLSEKKDEKLVRKRKIESADKDTDECAEPSSRKAQKSEPIQQWPKKKCILCPNLGAEIQTENGKYAHRLCAEFIPETMVTAEESTGKEMVFGVFEIPTARKKLKCQICNTANGAGIQCAQEKCYRAYHPTCARNSSVYIRSTTFEDGSVLYECFCSQHSPNAVVDRARQKEETLKQISESMTVGQLVYAKWPGGSYFSGTILEKFEEKLACRIAFEDGSKLIVLWKNISVNPVLSS